MYKSVKIHLTINCSFCTFAQNVRRLATFINISRIIIILINFVQLHNTTIVIL